MQSITVYAPAKLNLALDITGLTDKGYHQMDMIMQTVNLYEIVSVRKSNNLTINLPGSSVPANNYNTAIKAAREFFYYTGLLAGADILVRKAVPVRAGMAGGSADAAAVLVGLNKIYSAKLSDKELCEIGLKVGADVPFSIIGGTARVRGIGDEIMPLSPMPSCWFCVCMPPKGVSTAEAFKRFDELGATNHPNCDIMQNAITHKNLYALAKQVHNVLEENSESQYNANIKSTMLECGALASAMTGSGAAVFGIFNSKTNAYTAKNALLKDYPNVWILRPANRGALCI